VIPFDRARALRSTALSPLLATGLSLAVALSGLSAGEAWAANVPLPKPRPAARNLGPKTTAADSKDAAKGEKPKAENKAEKPERPKSTVATAPPLAAPPAARPRAAAAPPRKPAIPAAVAATSSTSRSDMDALENVIELVRKHNPADATQAEAQITDPVARKLAEWIILRSDDNGATVERYRAFLSANPSWPSQSFFRRRLEAALWDDHREDQAVWSWFETESPLTAKGRFSLARVMLARGDRANAERLVREAWHNDPMSEDTETTALDMFGALLTAGDQKARMDTLLYGSEHSAALRAAKRLGSGYVALAKARIAAYEKAPNLRPLLELVPPELHGDTGYLFAKIQLLRREEKFVEAAQLMLSAPKDPARLKNLDEWWIERRLLARKMIDVGEHRNAYLIARDAALPTRDIYKTEQEFTAGWIALRFLNDPATAAQHFARIGVGSANPTTLARAGYWQGRAAEAMGEQAKAERFFEIAAQYTLTYYGQLARARLGLTELGLRGPPLVTPQERAAARHLEIVRAVELLYALDERDLIASMYAEIGENGSDIAGMTMMAEEAAKHHDGRAEVLLGEAAYARGMPFDYFAYPTAGLPDYRPIGPPISDAVAYSIARQESHFNQKDVSPAQAMGLMQVTPDSAIDSAKRFKATYNRGRLLSDAVYNMQMGAAELSMLLRTYNGSYILTFAGYNAGRGRVQQWIAAYGDPRRPGVDPVDWVERIPLSETRNYVMRVMENLQVYRARFGGGSDLLIEADLRRGATN